MKVPYTVRHQDVVSNTLTAFSQYNEGFSHLGVNDKSGANAGVPFPVDTVPCCGNGAVDAVNEKCDTLPVGTVPNPLPDECPSCPAGIANSAVLRAPAAQYRADLHG